MERNKCLKSEGHRKCETQPVAHWCGMCKQLGSAGENLGLVLICVPLEVDRLFV